MKSKSLRRVGRILLILGASLVIYIFFTIYQSNKTPGKLPSFFGYTPLTVLSNSMNPHLESGDLTFVKRVAFDEISVGDVITFRVETDKFITHRIIQKTEKNGQAAYVTKGDNNNAEDANPVLKEQLIGKQVFTIPKVGILTQFMSKPLGFMLFLAVPFTGYICLSVYERLARTRKTETNTIGGS
ncbi:signal peptidase [Bacillus pakistanensis]|uniref:Signal peptidase I n=1 Tax=Rossellomorea pakistanensis TaxID=992288 RepID=A0ABS2NDJ2_9BACI|nr:signal peptidase I [Bacillus pakistanensis]MBM7585931.1 signal peptidase [Bacillus pakistanensis]